MTTKCERCGARGVNTESVQVTAGRDHPPRPPEHADLCVECREETTPDPVDVECAVCEADLENHHPDDPPLCRGCDWDDLEEAAQ